MQIGRGPQLSHVTSPFWGQLSQLSLSLPQNVPSQSLKLSEQHASSTLHCFKDDLSDGIKVRYDDGDMLLLGLSDDTKVGTIDGVPDANTVGFNEG